VNRIFSFLMTRGPRLVAAAASVAIVKGAAHVGLSLDPAETQGAILATYAIVHRAISSSVNPGDAAKGRVAAAEKVAADNGGVASVIPSR